jgi:hypothetical protein
VLGHEDVIVVVRASFYMYRQVLSFDLAMPSLAGRLRRGSWLAGRQIHGRYGYTRRLTIMFIF